MCGDIVDADSWEECTVLVISKYIVQCFGLNQFWIVVVIDGGGGVAVIGVIVVRDQHLSQWHWNWLNLCLSMLVDF